MAEEEHPLEMLKRRIAEGKVTVTEVDLRDGLTQEKLDKIRDLKKETLRLPDWYDAIDQVLAILEEDDGE